MFGDMGHGLLMTCAALYLVIRESRLLAQKSDNEVSADQELLHLRNITFGGVCVLLNINNRSLVHLYIHIYNQLYYIYNKKDI